MVRLITNTLLVLDGGGWDSSPRINVPENVVLLPLPPCAPVLNPVGNVWAGEAPNCAIRRPPRRGDAQAPVVECATPRPR